MKIIAKQVLKRKKAYSYTIVDPNRLDRLVKAEQLSIIGETAKEFAEQVLLDFDLPVDSKVELNNLHGFEDINKSVKEVVGYVSVIASFKALSGHIVRLTIPIPCKHGTFHRPSVVVYNGKLKILSQQFFDDIIESLNTTRLKVKNPMSPFRVVDKFDNVEREEFAPPEELPVYEGYDPLWINYIN